MSRRAVIIGLIALLAAIPLVAVWAFQRSFIYYPDTSNPGAASDRFTHGRDVSLHTEDGLTLNAWLIAPASPNGMAVLYLPGNAGNRLGRVQVAQAIADEGFTVLLVDYRGFGGNPGSPSEEGLIMDARAAASFLRDEGFAAEHTIYLGESIGTGVATALAVSDPPAGLMLRSPYTSLDAVAKRQTGLPLGWIMQDHFDTLSRIEAIESPVVVLAGESDTLIPLEQSKKVAARAPNLVDLIVMPGAGHNDPVWFGPFMAQQLSQLARATGR